MNPSNPVVDLEENETREISASVSGSSNSNPVVALKENKIREASASASGSSSFGPVPEYEHDDESGSDSE